RHLGRCPAAGSPTGADRLTDRSLGEARSPRPTIRVTRSASGHTGRLLPCRGHCSPFFFAVKESKMGFFDEPQGAAIFKHAVLSDYIPVFTRKVGSRSAGGRVNYLDGFAGA